MAIDAHMPKDQLNIALIGFGEAAQAFVSGWRSVGMSANLTAYDTKTDMAGPPRQHMQNCYLSSGVAGCGNAPEAVEEADVIFSFVTADQALVAARSVLKGLAKGALYFDCNSCAPNTKQAAARLLEDAGARYLDVAVMAPVHPRLHETPVLVSGKTATLGLETMLTLGMNVKTLGPDVGQASAVKLVRSIMVKGMEALSAECLLAGRSLGVEDVVLATLNETNPGLDWNAAMHRNLERMMVHGRRRASEMREACAMVEGLGLPGRMAQATANWQQQVGEQALAPEQEDIGARADRLRAALTGANARRRALRTSQS